MKYIFIVVITFLSHKGLALLVSSTLP